MKKWSEIKQATLHKLFLQEEEARQQNYLEKFQYLANEGLNIIANGVKPRIVAFNPKTTNENELVTMPDDFLSFADMINYVDGVADPVIVYVGDRQLKLPVAGEYTIYYNALWRDITEDDIKNDNILEIDSSVLNCIPSYVASQLLSQDDIQRSTSLKNEFELMLSRLDTNIMYQQNHFRSEGGWY